MHTIVFMFFFIVIMLLSLPILLFVYLLKLINPKASSAFGFFMAKFWANYLMFFSRCTFTVTGKEHFKPGQNYVLVGNHKSFFDIPTMLAASPIHFGFVAKDDLGSIPVFSHWMRSFGCLFIDRKDTRAALKTILLGIEMLKSGSSLIVFPEGTRSKLGPITEFKQGSLKLATKSNVPVLPFCIIGTENFYEKNTIERGKFRFTKTQVTVKFGAPIDLNTLSEEDQKHSAKYIQNIVQNLILEA